MSVGEVSRVSPGGEGRPQTLKVIGSTGRYINPYTWMAFSAASSDLPNVWGEGTRLEELVQ